MQLTHSIKVATWNIHSGMNQAGTYIDLTKDSRNLLANGAYDVVGLQEVRVNYSASNPNSKYPINALTSAIIPHGVFYKAFSLSDEPTADFGNGVLSKHTLSNFTQYTLPNNAGSEIRILTQADITINGKKIYLFVSHLRYDDDASRASQMQFIKEKLDALNGQSFVLFGDFNVRSTSEFDIFLPAYKIANGNGGVYYDTYNLTDWPTKKIDNIICSADFTVNSPAVVSTTLSDHSIFYTQLEWTETVPDPVAPPIITDVAKPPVTDSSIKPLNKTPLIHVLDRKTDEIVCTLNAGKAEYWNAVRHDSLNAENTLDFVVNASHEKSALLEKRNRLLIQDEDGLFREYIINYAEQYKRNEKTVQSDASFVDIAKAKVIEPQELIGTTAILSAQLALSGTEWKIGNIEFTGTQTIKIDNYTNPLELIKIIAETFGLEFSFRIEVDGNKVVGRYVDMGSQISGFNGKEIVFAKDLVGVTRKEDSAGIVTALYGIHEKSDGTKLSVWVHDNNAFQRWGRGGQHLVDWFIVPGANDEDMTVERLTALTQAELDKRLDAIVTYECDAVSLENIFGREHEKIRVGQTVRIKDDGYNPPLYLEARIQEVDVDQATNQIQSFKIFNFTEFSKAELEAQIATLKQQMAQKAARVVLGTDGENIINLDEGGFKDLNAGNISSPSVPNFNEKDIAFYVDPAGDDKNDGLTNLTPKKTIQACIDSIPKVNNGAISINCKAPTAGVEQDYTGNVIIEGFAGSGSILVEGVNWYNYINGRIFISGCTNSVYINNFTVNLTEVTKDAVAIYKSTNVQFSKIWVYGQGANAAFFATEGSNVKLSECESYDTNFAIATNETSRVYVDRCKGYGTGRGLVSQAGANITVYSTYPGGGTSDTYNDTGGSIALNGATVNSGTTGSNPTPVQQFTKQWTSNVADNWSTSYSKWQGGGAKQGDWGYGQRKGFWWFESNPIALSGKTIKSMRVWVKRAGSGGNTGKVRIYLHPHTFSTKASTPSNPSLALESSYNVYVDLAWGDPGVWVNIPSTWFAGFQSGSYKGIGIWAGSTSRSYYAVMDGQCWLEATYQ